MLMTQPRPAVQVRAAVGVVGSIVAGLPSSAEQPRRDPSAHSPRLAAISEVEPMGVDAPDERLESQPSQAAGKAAAKGGNTSGETQRSNARKRTAPAAQPEPVPEQNERTKRRKRSPAAKPDKAAPASGSPSEANAQGKGSKTSAAVSSAADDAGDDAAANDPEPGDLTEVVALLEVSPSRGMRHEAWSCTVKKFLAFGSSALVRRVPDMLQAAVVPRAVVPSRRPFG